MVPKQLLGVHGLATRQVRLLLYSSESGLTITNTWDALQRLRRVDYPDDTFVTNSYKWLDLAQVVNGSPISVNGQ